MVSKLYDFSYDSNTGVLELNPLEGKKLENEILTHALSRLFLEAIVSNFKVKSESRIKANIHVTKVNEYILEGAFSNVKFTVIDLLHPRGHTFYREIGLDGESGCSSSSSKANSQDISLKKLDSKYADRVTAYGVMNTASSDMPDIGWFISRTEIESEYVKGQKIEQHFPAGHSEKLLSSNFFVPTINYDTFEIVKKENNIN